MTTHTPGPWHVLPTLTGALSINVTSAIPVATVGGAGWHLGEATAHANAHLIAAAPDMLAALKVIVEWGGSPGGYTAAVKAARAAIAKATGKEG